MEEQPGQEKLTIYVSRANSMALIFLQKEVCAYGKTIKTPVRKLAGVSVSGEEEWKRCAENNNRKDKEGRGD